MKLETLKILVDALNLLIKESMSEEGREVCIDGAINLEKYIKSKIKIMWILKEPYDETNGIGGGFSLSELIQEDVAYEDFVKRIPTWQVITYTSYGILNNFSKWSEMDFLRDDPKMTNVLQEITMINTQKLPSLNQTTTNPGDIAYAFEKYKNFLYAQIELLNPTVLIGGNTMTLYKDLFGLNNIEFKNHGSLRYWEKDDKLYIDAYHPAQKKMSTGVSREQYCDEIISLVENWYNL